MHYDALYSNDLFAHLAMMILNNVTSFKNLQSLHTYFDIESHTSTAFVAFYSNERNLEQLTQLEELCITIPTDQIKWSILIGNDYTTHEFEETVHYFGCIEKWNP